MPIIGSIGGGSAGGFGQRKGGVAPIAADYLIVAGGASGSTGDHSGGGGAGGYRTSFPGGTEIEIKGGDNTVTVGAGGAAIVNPPNPLPQYKNGNQGSDSDIQGVTTITSAGGGCGLEGSGANISPYGEGGSGGGGYYVASSGPRQGFGFGLGNIPNVSPPQGNPGGQGSPTAGGGGGGGAGSPGNAGPSGPEGGPGGDGSTTNITGSPVTYAGGGGGGTYGMGSPGGSGGSGGKLLVDAVRDSLPLGARLQPLTDDNNRGCQQRHLTHHPHTFSDSRRSGNRSSRGHPRRLQ